MSNESNFPSDDKLLGALTAGGEEAEEAKRQLYEKYSRLVSMVIGRILGPKRCDHIAGVNQESWITIIKKVGTVRDPNALPGWLKTLAERKAYKHLREQHREEDVPFKDDRQASDGGLAGLEQGIESSERIAKVRAAAKTISPKFSQILDLYLDGLDFEEIALVVGETLVNVRNIFYRGLRKLRRLLGDKPGQGGDRP